MTPLQRLSAMRTRAFRRSEGPQTPEPTSSQQDIDLPPSPPRQRFRLKRRAASRTPAAPTEQFLASVDAADVPIPSIEEPFVVDEDMLDTTNQGAFATLSEAHSMELPHSGAHQRMFSPPKTPAPGELNLSIATTNQFPDWSNDSTFSDSECESSRPSTARSNRTSASYFSQSSFASDDASLISPDQQFSCRFDKFLSPDDADRTIKPSAPVRAAKSRKAPWTRAMDNHIWTTYTMYLQDPKVTPVRIGASGVPPCGVVARVAREASRSWRGSNALKQSKDCSGSTTPTAGSKCTYIKWPHTNAATRAHLVEMCKANAGGKGRNERYFASSPTPFGKTMSRARARRTTPARAPSIFSGGDMAMSLAVSTSDSMQLGGPLAQLTTAGQQEEAQELPPLPQGQTSLLPPYLDEPRPRLGSPFVAKSYGPSTSSSFAEMLGSETPRQSNSMGARRGLKSPVRVNRSRSNTQKRRADLEARRSKRPSLPSDMWSEPGASPIAPSSDFDNMPSIFANMQQPVETAARIPSRAFLHSLDNAPPRLGSPFGGLPSSFSFPARGSSVLAHLAAAAPGAASNSMRPFSSMQQWRETPRTRTPLPDRLAYIDERLKQIRQRSEERRRSESPL
ncbi:uncharacterized protein J7T54_005952 [Emericellopsis cladophorae]|uniref:Uncharacterized protein n=1 Tax=Emericellopsis cladophorae TaxID=2686198 RepID=A0A9P9Y9L1_9HYPO|nr:uncharacterized protein J7T54_005952 [Emericellopsis cladophorae]KAI6785618.1 hypothetical protein J7T54_005952 [Emericellopsis cladophorae]